MKNYLKILSIIVLIFSLQSCGGDINDSFLTNNKWTDGSGSVFVFDTEGDNGNYNPLVLQTSSVLTRVGNFKINGDIVIINWTNGDQTWKLKKTGSNLKLILDSGFGVKLRPI